MPNRTWRSHLGALTVALALALLSGLAAYLAIRPVAPATQPPARLDALAAVMAGAMLDVGPADRLSIRSLAQGVLLSRPALAPDAEVRIDLCRQRSLAADDPQRIIPIRIGYRWPDVEGLARENQRRGNAPHVGLRHVVLERDGGANRTPRLRIDGRPVRIDDPLRLRVEDAGQGVESPVVFADGETDSASPDAGATASFTTEAWVVWHRDEGATEDFRRALRLRRQASETCAAGQIVVAQWRVWREAPRRRVHLSLKTGGGEIMDIGAMPAGSYRIPERDAPAVEDQALFEAATEAGLIRPAHEHFIELAPRDLAAWAKAAPATRLATDWDTLVLDERTTRLLHRLHDDADGHFIRRQLALFNAQGQIAAVRVRMPEPGAKPAAAYLPAQWRASVDGVPTRIVGDMPSTAIRHFAELPLGWGPWGRIAVDQPSLAAHDIALRLPVEPRSEGIIEVLILGRYRSLVGGKLIRPPENACDGPACRAPGDMQRLVVRAEPGATDIQIRLHAMPLSAPRGGAGASAAAVHIVKGRPIWRPPASGRTQPMARATVTIYDSHGTPLYADGQIAAPAREAGLAALLGAYPEQAQGLSDMLSRLGETGAAHVAARMTLELPMQQVAHDVLSCLGYGAGRRHEGRCESLQAAPAGRRAGLVLMDTANGDILAAAGLPLPPPQALTQDIAAFDLANPAQSPLRIPAWQHDGGALRAAGSTFKLLTALALEGQASTSPAIDALLRGLPPSARAADFRFDARSPCYPAPCAGKALQVRNFRDEIPAHTATGMPNLAEALAHSYNTWFAYGAELSDRSLLGRGEGGIPDLRALDRQAFDEIRPVAGIAHRLGFAHALRLDGGLLPDDYPWRDWDVLQNTPSALDPVDSRHNLRQQAIGLRMQATPLQMARVAAAIGEGRSVTPRLLAELDGRRALVGGSDELDMRLDRIRAGMKAVVDSGTARTAFASSEFAAIGKYVYGKTGTAPTPSIGEHMNTAWFIGWVEPGAWPGLERRIAFACFVTHSRLTGGAQAAPVVAELLRELNRQSKAPELPSNGR